MKTAINTLIIMFLVGIIIALVLLGRPEQIKTVKVEQPIVVEPIGTPTPRASEEYRGTPTPRSSEEAPPTSQPGIAAENIYPSEVNFWVNELRIGETSMYEGANFIPIKKSNIKTFAGNFGPYYSDPTAHLTVKLCSEYTKVQAAPVCEAVPMIYRDNMVSFAKGYQYDEYIGGSAAKDYTAYFNVYAGDTLVAASNKASIRTVSD